MNNIENCGSNHCSMRNISESGNKAFRHKRPMMTLATTIIRGPFRIPGLRLRNLNQVVIVPKPYYLLHIPIIVIYIKFLNSNPDPGSPKRLPGWGRMPRPPQESAQCEETSRLSLGSRASPRTQRGALWIRPIYIYPKSPTWLH